MNVRSTRILLSVWLPLLSVGMTSCLSTPQPAELANRKFLGCRIYTPPSTEEAQFWIVLENGVNEEGVIADGVLGGCLASRRTNNRVDYVTLSGTVSGNNDNEAIITAPRSETNNDEERIVATVVPAPDGEPETDGPLVRFVSAHQPYNIPDPLPPADPSCTCEGLEALFKGSNRVAPLLTESGFALGAGAALDSLDQEFALDWLPATPKPRDSRFFGTYCQVGSERVCRKIRRSFFGIPRTKTVCADLKNIRLELEHLDGRARGSLYGFGHFDLKDQTLEFASAGRVDALGTASLSLQLFDTLGRHSGDGNAKLISNFDPVRGMDHALLIGIFDETITLAKQACGNRAPRVSLTSESGDTLVWGQNHCFTGRVMQDEDTDFPPMRLSMASSIDGEFAPPNANISASSPLEITRCTTGLSPGGHTISFTAVDSGGLPARASVDVEVSNRGPLTPVLVQPRSDDTIVASGDVIFEGKAFDYEEGMLTGSALTWEASREGAPFVWLGLGQQLLAEFPEEGVWTVRLTATDGAGESSQRLTEVDVQPFAGNTVPRVTIGVPQHLKVPGHFGGSFPPGDVIFRGTVDDTEDTVGNLRLRWDARAIQPPGDPLPPVLDSTLAVFPLTGGSNRTVYEIVFRATDSGGLEGKKVIQVLVIAE